MSQPTRRKGGLGRGLASLIPTGPAEGETDANRLSGPRIGNAAFQRLSCHHGQPRIAAAGNARPEIHSQCQHFG